MTNPVLPTLQTKIETLIHEFSGIPTERKPIINQLTQFIKSESASGGKIKLNFICTHNSRRSHISQLWAQAAAHYFGIGNVETYSGGTEATAFNPRAVKAMQDLGFDITLKQDGKNPVYEVRFSKNAPPVVLFSKKYDDPFNPSENFAAIMTCSHADENCPWIPGASKRIALTYNDPKDFDGTPQEVEKYRERANEIGRDILYAFSQAR
jgi:arsenate reductase (thioredoxin)